jgi:hypothetical protein
METSKVRAPKSLRSEEFIGHVLFVENLEKITLEDFDRILEEECTGFHYDAMTKQLQIDCNVEKGKINSIIFDEFDPMDVTDSNGAMKFFRTLYVTK